MPDRNERPATAGRHESRVAPDREDRAVALITGGSGGLGLVIAETFLRHGYRVVIVGRDQARIEVARQGLLKVAGVFADSAGASSEAADLPAGESLGVVLAESAELTDPAAVSDLFESVSRRAGRLDVLVNCVGASDRGLIETLATENLDELIRRNVHTALLCSQSALPLLESSRGVIVNIGSLASKVGARYIGGYAVAKHALAGMTQQMRLELKPRGIHVALVSPGPIRRDDAGKRYADRVDSTLPAQASAPGGGTRVKGLDPRRVAEAVVKAATRRRPDSILPRHMRALIAIGHAFPRLGDWLLLKFTSSK